MDAQAPTTKKPNPPTYEELLKLVEEMLPYYETTDDCGFCHEGIGRCAGCRELSYRPHKSDCTALVVRSVLGRRNRGA